MVQQEETKKSVCLWCKGECGVLVKVRNGRLIKTEENPGYPRKVFPRLAACPRARNATEYVYHPGRVRYPLKRIGDRGEGKWQQVPWKQALDEIAEKLGAIKKEYGAEAISGNMGTYRTSWEYQLRFFHALGSPNLCIAIHICTGPRQGMGHLICGNFSFYSAGPKSRCVMLLGIEPDPARPRSWNNIREGLAQGAKLIVIDPRRTASAGKADLWLQLRPGTDCALLLGMINVIISERLYDRDFVEKWCYGFDKIQELVKEYPLDKVAEITWVPAEKIEEAARMYATNKPGVIMEGMGVEEQQDSAEILHARWILSAIVGNIDVEGGEEFKEHHHPKVISNREVQGYDLLPREQGAKQLGSDRFILFSYEGREIMQQAMLKAWGSSSAAAFCFAHPPSMVRAIITEKPYPVKALITVAHNDMLSSPNIKMIYKALKSPNLDLHVVMDLFMTPTAELADYVLPTTCWIERPLLILPHGDQDFMTTGVAALPAVMPGEYEYKNEYDIWRELSIRLGLGEHWPRKTLEEEYDYRMKGLGCTHKEFVEKEQWYLPPPKWKKYQETGFGTPTGKVELYSTTLEMLHRSPLPRFREPHETPMSSPELAKEYPLMLISGGRIRQFYHSEWRQVEPVRKQHPEPIMQINPETARQLGISQGDWVWIENIRGRIRQKAELFDGIHPRVVHAEHDWWFPELPGEEPSLHGVWESNVNVLTQDDPEICGKIIGGWGLKTALCKVYKDKEF